MAFITADQILDELAEIRRFLALIPVRFARPTGGGGESGFWAIIVNREGRKYSWIEAEMTTNGTFVTKDGGKTGRFNAYEVNRSKANIHIPGQITPGNGNVVWLRKEKVLSESSSSACSSSESLSSGATSSCELYVFDKALGTVWNPPIIP